VLDVNFFDELRIGLATADDIRQWSHGEVRSIAADPLSTLSGPLPPVSHIGSVQVVDDSRNTTAASVAVRA
jgi:hypothetical protein